MKSGKLNWDILKKIIDENSGVKREDVKVSGGIGEDCSIVEFGEYDCVLSTDPITAAGENIGKLAVNINCNDVASAGVDPIALMVTILVPESAELCDIKKIMKQMHEESKKLNVAIIGGHTEVTNAVNKIVVSCTVLGKGKKGKAISTAGAEVGDEIVITKELCMEGASIIAGDLRDKAEKVLSKEEIEKALEYSDKISVVEEGRIASLHNVSSMHDITEGGILGALWEVASASNKGFKVYEDKMPISNITKRLCDYFNIDPLKTISSGSMLITIKNSNKLINALKQKGIEAVAIGKIVEREGMLIRHNGVEEIVLPPERDEIYKIV